MRFGSNVLTEDFCATRLRKMVTRDIGLLYFGLPLSTEPRSVLYNNILSVDDLDGMGQDF